MSTAGQEQARAEPLPAISMRSAGERGLVVEMGKEISPRVNARVRRLAGGFPRKASSASWKSSLLTALCSSSLTRCSSAGRP